MSNTYSSVFHCKNGDTRNFPCISVHSSPFFQHPINSINDLSENFHEFVDFFTTKA